MAIVLHLPPPPPPPIPPSAPAGVTRVRARRLYSVLTMPPDFLDWRIRCGFGNAPTLESVQEAIADVQRTTVRRLRQATDAELSEEVNFWLDMIENQLETLRCWQKPRGRRGKPKGKGAYFQTREEFVRALLLAMRHVQKYNPPVKKTKVARIFHHVPGGYKTRCLVPGCDGRG